jgi:NADH-quinone oxidoreductase subunit N
VFLYSRRYLEQRNIAASEFYLLALLSMLGAMVLVSANTLLTVYLGLELLSLPLYALVAIRRDSGRAAEAAMKYFVMGALASALLLYGMSLVYGATGSIVLSEIAGQTANTPVMLFGAVFFIVGVCFKLGAVPFHMWVPDVYEGSPTATTLYLGSVPKLAAFAMLVRLLVQAMPGLGAHWQLVLMVIAVLCLVGGNLAALMQRNMKRLLAYSTIGHVGFILLGVSVNAFNGVGAALFYVIIYVLMAVGGFAMVLLLSNNEMEADKIEDFAGLNSRHSWLALMMLLLMFSMAGIPPLVGFTAKLVVLKSLVAQGDYYLAGLALLMSVVAAFYYIRVVKIMYFEAPHHHTPITIEKDAFLGISVNGLLMLALGLLPAALLAYCFSALAG